MCNILLYRSPFSHKTDVDLKFKSVDVLFHHSSPGSFYLTNWLISNQKNLWCYQYFVAYNFIIEYYFFYRLPFIFILNNNKPWLERSGLPFYPSVPLPPVQGHACSVLQNTIYSFRWKSSWYLRIVMPFSFYYDLVYF